MSELSIETMIEHADKAVKNKEYNEAVSILKDILHLQPNSVAAHTRLGNLLMYSQSQQKALTHLEKAVELDPGDVKSWLLLSNFYTRLKDWKGAQNVYKRALQHHPDDEKLLYDLALTFKYLHMTEDGIEVAKRLYEKEKDNKKYHELLTELYELSGKDLFNYYDHEMQNSDTLYSVAMLEKWLKTMLERGKYEEALSRLKSFISKDPENLKLQYLYIYTCIEIEEYDEAYHQANALSLKYPENLDLYRYLIKICRIRGDKDEASKYYKKALDINPFNVALLLPYIMDGHAQYGNERFNRACLAASRITSMDEKEQMQVHFVLGKVFNDVEDLPTAFEHYRQGGSLHVKDKKPESKGMTALLDIFKKGFGADEIEKFKNQSKNLSEAPLFIVGMPRSGTTLLEQVLSSIEGIHGVGETRYISHSTNYLKIGETVITSKYGDLFAKEGTTMDDRANYYLQSVEKMVPADAKRIVDKMPGNFSMVGIIHAMFPKAHIIHSRRHPVETCLSAYRLLFLEGHYWSYDLKEMGKYYRAYWDMMSYWREVLPEGTMLEVRYEDMVNDLETQSKRIASYIEMPWNRECLEFHKSKKAVKTASLNQVRQPLYKSSMNRWRQYEPYLKPLLDEIGDIVELYEAELEDAR